MNDSQFIFGSAYRIPNNPTQHCLYVLWLDDEIVYVGQTNCLERRILVHKKSDKRFDGYSFELFDTAAEAINLERELIRQHKPKYNKQVFRSQYLEKLTEVERAEKAKRRLEKREQERMVAKERHAKRIEEMKAQFGAWCMSKVGA